MGQGQSRFDQFPTRVVSGQLTGLVTGTSYSLPDVGCTSLIVIGHPSNTGNVWVGNSTGTASGSTGYPLTTSNNPMVFDGLSNVMHLKANFDTAGDKICWIAEVVE